MIFFLLNLKLINQLFCHKNFLKFVEKKFKKIKFEWQTKIKKNKHSLIEFYSTCLFFLN